jgi:hypothetical protein
VLFVVDENRPPPLADFFCNTCFFFFFFFVSLPLLLLGDLVDVGGDDVAVVVGGGSYLPDPDGLRPLDDDLGGGCWSESLVVLPAPLRNKLEIFPVNPLLRGDVVVVVAVV